MPLSPDALARKSAGMRLTIYDPFAYGPGETGPFGTQTAEIITERVTGLPEATRRIAKLCYRVPARRIGVTPPGRKRSFEGVPVPPNSYLITVRDRCLSYPFALAEGGAR